MAINWGLLQNQRPWLSEGINSFSQGFLTPYVAKEQAAKADMTKMQTDQAKQQQQALNEYQQTGDPKSLMSVNPQLYMKIKDWVDTRPPEELTTLAKGTQYLQMVRPYLNQNTWPTIRGNLAKMGMDDKMLPPENASPQDLHEMLWGTASMDAMIKNYVGKGHKPGEFIQTPQGLQQVPYGEKEQAEIRAKKAQAEKNEALAKDPLGNKEPKVFEDLDTGDRFTGHNTDPRVLGKNVREFKPGMTPLPMIDELIKGVDKETTPPSALSKRGIDINTTLARASKLGVNWQGKTLKFEMLKDQAKHLASQQQENFIATARELGDYSDKVISLAKELDLSPLRAYNWGKLKSLAQAGGDSPTALLARKYVSAVNGAKALLTRVDSTGYAPTTDAWKVAHEQLDEYLPVGQVTAQLESVRDMVNFRLAAMNEMRESAVAGKIDIPLSKSGGNREEGKTEGDPFKKPAVNMNPSEQRAIDKAKQDPKFKESLKASYPEFYKRAFPGE